ncbi:MAG: Pr6Pr family membrane protein [Acidimicrobiales bacterium]
MAPRLWLGLRSVVAMQFWARIWFAVTALVVVVAMVVQVRSVAQLDAGFFDTDAKRIANIFGFFTIWSNLLVGAVCALLAVRLDRPSLAFRAAYLTAVVMIAVTFMVAIVALDPITQYEGKAAAADFLTHKLVPILAVGGWLVFGPRAMVSPAVVRLSVAIPVLWLAFTLARGPLASDYYPYPFVDVADLGYARVLVNVVLVTGLFLGLAAGANVLDRRLPGITATGTARPSRGP